MEPSPPIAIIFSIDSWVRSSLSFALPSRWAIQMLSFFWLTTRCMYSDMRLLLTSMSLMPALLNTMNDLFTLTKSFIHGAARRLSPMAISHVVLNPDSMSITSSSAESRTMSRWLLTKVYRRLLSMLLMSMSQPVLAFFSKSFRNG